MMIRHDKLDSENGIAYGLIFLIIFVAIAAILYLTISVAENQVLDKMNDFITQGTVSQRTKDAIEWNRNMTMALPVVAILGALLYAIMRGTQSRDGVPGDTGHFMTGFILLVLFSFCGFLMSFCGGLILDNLYTKMDNAGLISPDDISSDWSEAQMSGFNTYSGLYYLLCMACPLGGIVLFIKSVTARTVGNRYLYGGGY